MADGDGNEVGYIDDLTYVTVEDGNGTSISGYDITETSGLITLVNNKEIVASPRTEEQYNITLILVNYDFDQNNNAGKSFNAKLMIQKESASLSGSNTCKNDQGIESCIVSLYGKDDNLYYHDSGLANGAGDNSYRYAGASDVVNNYVCFGSDETTCPVDNLYRIIGVFDGRVKLIKADYATSALLGTDGDYKAAYSYSTANYKGSLSTSDIAGYYWNYNANNSASNTWSTSLLNKTNLNTNYLNNIGSKWANMIDTTTWKVGGNTYANIYNQISSVAYQNEIVNPVTTNTTDNATEYSAKVGLMYASDYGFAADPSAWTTTLNKYNTSSISSKNWMYMGLYEFVISRRADYSNFVFYVSGSGSVSDFIAKDVEAIRPVFFLSSLVNFASGDGSASNQIRVKL